MDERVKKRIAAKMRLIISDAIVFKGFLPLLWLLSAIMLDFEMLWATEKLIPEIIAAASPKLYRLAAVLTPMNRATNGSYSSILVFLAFDSGMGMKKRVTAPRLRHRLKKVAKNPFIVNLILRADLYFLFLRFFFY